jgi:guanylate kinase
VSVSVTTRRPRPGEVDGVQYHFVDRPEYEQMVAAGDLVEHAEYAGNGYGTPRTPLVARLAAGDPVLLEIEPQGARQVLAWMPEAYVVFLAPPSWEELVRRLTGRATEDAEVVARRLAVAREELAAASEFNAVVVNDDVGRAADELVRLIESPTKT